MSFDVITQENWARLQVARRVSDIAKSMMRLSTLGRSIVPTEVPSEREKNPADLRLRGTARPEESELNQRRDCSEDQVPTRGDRQDHYKRTSPAALCEQRNRRRRVGDPEDYEDWPYCERIHAYCGHDSAPRAQLSPDPDEIAEDKSVDRINRHVAAVRECKDRRERGAPGRKWTHRHPSLRRLRLREFALSQLASQDFPDERLGEVPGELDHLGDLERREAFLAECDDLLFRRRGSALQDNECLDRLTTVRVRDTDRRRFPDGRMHEEDFLDLPRIDVVAGTQDHVLLAVYDVEVAVFVHLRDVPRQKPSVSEDHRGFLGLVPVPLHDLRPMDRQLAHFPSGSFL